MSVYSTISDILSAGNGNITELAKSLESELPVSHSGDQAATFPAAASITGSAWTNIRTLSSISVEADDLIIVFSTATVSGSNVSDEWIFSHSLGGSRPATFYGSFTASASSTGGREATIPVVSVWKDLTAGTVNITHDYSVNGGTSSGTLRVGYEQLHVFKFKRK